MKNGARLEALLHAAIVRWDRLRPVVSVLSGIALLVALSSTGAVQAQDRDDIEWDPSEERA